MKKNIYIFKIITNQRKYSPNAEEEIIIIIKKLPRQPRFKHKTVVKKEKFDIQGSICFTIISNKKSK